jgi:DNA-binding GntR family transcriptional regulator
LAQGSDWLKKPAVRAAIDFLRVGIAAGSWARDRHLPTTAELGRQAEVSKASMGQAVRVLVGEGTLDARPGRGIRLGSPSISRKPKARLRSKIETLTSDLVNNIVMGEYGPNDELPSLKELEDSFGVCFRSIRRVIDSLVEEGILSPRGRGYRVNNRASRSGFKKLVLIVGREHGQRLSEYSYARSYFYPLLYALERECSRRNIRLEVEHPPARIQNFAQQKNVIGYFVAIDGDPTSETIELIRRLATFDVPVLVSREGHHRAFASLPASPNLLFLEDSNELAGFQVGRHLLSRGHRRAAYLTHFVDRGWSIQRYLGLVRAFRLAGLPEAVTVVSLGARDIGKGGILLSPRIKTLLRASDNTALVACDDALAAHSIIPVLHRRGATLGTSVSLVGFNDQLEAFEHRFTSYNFNAEGLAAAVLFHAQFPERLRRRAVAKRREPAVISGYVIDRGSVRVMGSPR